MFSVCIDNIAVLYRLKANGSFEEAFRLKALDYFDGDLYLNLSRFDNSGKYLATGSTSGGIK